MSILSLGCSSEIVLHGRIDEVARSLHEAYLATQVAAGWPMGSARALVPWEALPDSLRQANRSQADHIPIKQQTLSLSSTPETIEALADAEHRRWMAEKIVANWRFSTTRDDARRLHPSIVAYNDLTEEEKQKDRDTVGAAMPDKRSPA